MDMFCPARPGARSSAVAAPGPTLAPVRSGLLWAALGPALVAEAVGAGAMPSPPLQAPPRSIPGGPGGGPPLRGSFLSLGRGRPAGRGMGLLLLSRLATLGEITGDTGEVAPENTDTSGGPGQRGKGSGFGLGPGTQGAWDHY